MVEIAASKGVLPVLRQRAQALWADRAARGVFLASALSTILILGFILWVLFSNSFHFFQEVSIIEFLTGTEWNTVPGSDGSTEDLRYGVLPLVSGTLLIAAGASLIGLPIGLGTAIYLAEYASPRVRSIVKPALELLAGVPSIVFGYFALQVISPIVHDLSAPGAPLYWLFGKQAGVFNAMNAIIVVGIMVLPIITSLSEDAIRAVPKHLREASMAMGATKWETTRKVVVPAALSGISASFVLGVARAVGETMAVSLAAGTVSNFTFNPMESIQTMTAFIAQRVGGDTPLTGVGLYAMFVVGAFLFLMTLVLNLVAQRFVKRYREVDVA